MLTYRDQEFLDILNEKFSDEIKQNKLTFKFLKLNGNDALIFITKNDPIRMNSTVMDTNIKYSFNFDNNCYELFIEEEKIDALFTKIKKTIFNICLVK